MNTDQKETKDVRKRQLAIEAELVEQLAEIRFPPYVGANAADQVEYAVHAFIDATKKTSR